MSHRRLEDHPVTDTGDVRVDHRPETELASYRCSFGHVGFGYRASWDGSLNCAACTKIRVYRSRGLLMPGGDKPATPRPINGRGTWFDNYAEARAHHEEAGGYLFRRNGGFYVTGSYHMTRIKRGTDLLRRMDAAGIWDEVELEEAGG